MPSYIIVWVFIEYKLIRGWGGKWFLKVTRVSHQPFFLYAYMYPPKTFSLIFSWLHQKVQPLFFFPYSFFFVLISFFFPCSYTTTPHLFFDFLKATRRLKKLSPSFIPTGPTPKERKSLNSSLPLTPTSPATRKKVSFNSSQTFVPTLKLEWF